MGSGFIVKNVKEIKPTPRLSKMTKPDPRARKVRIYIHLVF